ncbi:MAG: hypothetical protein IJE62_01335 [Clostridia bacterium]|nr:hypothetical protein [Clostridia bacterium]
MSINTSLVKELAEELVKMSEDFENKAKQHPVTEQEFLQFLNAYNEKNSLILKELGISSEPY